MCALRATACPRASVQSGDLNLGANNIEQADGSFDFSRNRCPDGGARSPACENQNNISANANPKHSKTAFHEVQASAMSDLDHSR